MFILQLNDMRGPFEKLTPIARATTAEDLFAIMDREKVDFYNDLGKPDHLSGAGNGTWHKAFKRGGPLEWFNPPIGEVHANDLPYIMNIGTEDEWADMARRDYRERVMSLPEAGTVGTFTETVVL
jgi:hypothetical protein